ncbi:DUF4843 domain-containing protein [Pseudoflavitalea sp. G-6-1-2]|uniref:DUF4843 domain-containing protein n=1 Tax=Pseudoflavitalea sp. G-6-1-2 TaxID=2728841 RepID=UPI00146D5705|nr:DUF4843 domain-containing protein [Pseudoflavitalea sp. G-6-1-2]NML21581.1 DUF4843 domain-containing protein [Pseudoflavitalea sp. G-6-1-2]
MKSIALYTLLGLSLAACKKDHTYPFQDVARLQFGLNNEGLQDTVKYYSFYYGSDDREADTIWFNIYAMGGITSEDRPYSLEQEMIVGEDNAVAGVHYKSFSDPSLKDMYVIKANEVSAAVPVVLLRDPSLKQQYVKLKFRIKGDAVFQPGETRFLWRRLEFTDKLSRPQVWDAYAEKYYWGKYSNVKHTFMIRQTGKLWDQEFMSELNRNVSKTLFWMDKLKQLLIDYNTAHPSEPLRDENNNLVTFP